ncbi:hypothetical protein SLEP1_g56785 [Rubroshorea leprosula]|uniref:Uncharacterized protein n=1 Tax=Rubroshorea leprosula TaxID=152421 RepID=A0AAV5MLP0_9ROSI|nr:hypothetical protein SLEP1_g56785 [Rubroshorea leprosula]
MGQCGSWHDSRASAGREPRNRRSNTAQDLLHRGSSNDRGGRQVVQQEEDLAALELQQQLNQLNELPRTPTARAGGGGGGTIDSVSWQEGRTVREQQQQLNQLNELPRQGRGREPRKGIL